VSLTLVVACALAWSVLDLARKRLAAELSPAALLLLLAAGQTPVFAVWALAGAPGWPGLDYLPPGLGSIVLNVLANLAFLEALRIAPLSLAVPLLSLTPALTTVMGAVLLGERPSAGDVVGTALVVAGAWLQSWPERSGPARAAVAGARGTLLMLAVALCWSAALPLDKLAVARSSLAVHALLLNLGVATSAALILAASRRWSELRPAARRPWLAVAAPATAAAAIALQLLAIQGVAVGVLETVKRAVGSTLALVFGRQLFGERVGWRRLAAVALMTLGVALVLG
jgi:drug/metabolite transporter (DMT)-like permease